MDADEKKTGGKMLANVHPGKRLNGQMFDDAIFTAKQPLDRDYAGRRRIGPRTRVQ
jgi:hypothetical protein